MKKGFLSVFAFFFLTLLVLTSCGGGGGGSDSDNSSNTNNTNQETSYDIRGSWKWNLDPGSGEYAIYVFDGTLEGGNMTAQTYGTERTWHYSGTYNVNGSHVELMYYCIEIGKQEPLLLEGHFEDKDTIFCELSDAMDRFGHHYTDTNCTERLHRLLNE